MVQSSHGDISVLRALASMMLVGSELVGNRNSINTFVVSIWYECLPVYAFAISPSKPFFIPLPGCLTKRLVELHYLPGPWDMSWRAIQSLSQKCKVVLVAAQEGWWFGSRRGASLNWGLVSTFMRQAKSTGLAIWHFSIGRSWKFKDNFYLMSCTIVSTEFVWWTYWPWQSWTSESQNNTNANSTYSSIISNFVLSFIKALLKPTRESSFCRHYPNTLTRDISPAHTRHIRGSTHPPPGPLTLCL